jgi:Spy/CpxP family protein refolding chaperone
MSREGNSGVPERRPPLPEEMLAHMSRDLGLTSDQQAKVKVILTADREKSAPLMWKMSEYRQQLRVATQAATFDEASIRAIALKQAQLEIELIVTQARVQNRIRTLLTP